MPQEPLEIAIEDIADWHPRLYVQHWVAACVAAWDETVAPPRDMIVECLNLPVFAPVASVERTLRWGWEEASAQKARRLRSTQQEPRLTEDAAYAVAAMVLPPLAGVTRMEVCQRGEGPDHWLEGGQYALEVSGTRQQIYLTDRHRDKIAQGLSNPDRRDAYVVVVCFEPTNLRAILSYHRQRENHE